jgi:hypothetical protein
LGKAAPRPEEAAGPETFGAVALEWLVTKKPGPKESRGGGIPGRLGKELLPILVGGPIADIKAAAKKARRVPSFSDVARG